MLEKKVAGIIQCGREITVREIEKIKGTVMQQLKLFNRKPWI